MFFRHRLLVACGFVLSASAFADLAEGLSAYYDFESGLEDQSGHARHLVAAGGSPEAAWAGGNVTRGAASIERSTLLAGNAVCYKPSEHATLTGLRLVDLLHRAGVPVDVVTAVVGGGPTGAALVAADVDMVCFTGSYPTGRRVAAAGSSMAAAPSTAGAATGA